MNAVLRVAVQRANGGVNADLRFWGLTNGGNECRFEVWVVQRMGGVNAISRFGGPTNGGSECRLPTEGGFLDDKSTSSSSSSSSKTRVFADLRFWGSSEWGE